MTGSFPMERLSDTPLHVSGITCEGKVWRSRRNHRAGGLVVLRGVYPTGSAGMDDARYICWLLSEFYALHRPAGLVLDCRELEYIWGDNLDFPTPAPIKADRFPLLVVLRPEQQEAFAYAVPREQHRVDLSAALAEMDEVIRGMKSLL
jgi:hypothetical protein